MSILGRVLLTLLALLACQGDAVTLWTHTLRTNMLKESIRLLDQLQQMEVSCNSMNVTNIFADYKGRARRWFEGAVRVKSEEMEQAELSRGNNMEILCKAATVAREGQSCHGYLEGIYHNLLSLVWGTRAGPKEPCPVAAGKTTSLKNFLKELHQVLQEEYKS